MLNGTKRFLQKTKIVLYDDHDEVIFAVGNWELRLPYDVALTVSQTMRVKAKKAKRFAGDNSRTWRVAGDLTDANPYPKKGRSQIVVR